MVKDEEIKGRYLSITIAVNIPNHKGEEDKVKEIAVIKARKILKDASKAPLEKG